MIPIIKIKRLSENATLPQPATPYSAGLDLTATSIRYDQENDFIEYGTDIAVEIPMGHVGLIFPRSSISKTDLMLCNHVGVIDSDYRGEIKFRFKIISTYLEFVNVEGNIATTYYNELEKESGIISEHNVYNVGDRIGQLVIVPCVMTGVTEITELSDTQRGSGGFGSTGN